MTGEPTVLGMINKNLDTISGDIKEIKDDMKNGAVKMENHSVRLENIETDVKDLKNGQKKIKEKVFDHATDKKVHYNQGYKETFSQRTWRRKDLIALMTAIATTIGFILKYGG